MIRPVDQSMVKDIASGVLILGGVATIVVAAELSAPVIATLGALTSIGTGVYQAVTTPKRKAEH